MKIFEVKENKKEYLDLLLLADEQESMIDRYLEQGDLFVLRAPETVGVCVVLALGGGVYEIKNLAVASQCQGRGYGRALIEFAMAHYPDLVQMLVGTGDSPLTLPFYQKCGFTQHHRVKNFFTDHYDHPIFEAGVQLVDMVYLSRTPAR